MIICPMPGCGWPLENATYFCCSRCHHRLSASEKWELNKAFDRFRRGKIDLAELARLRQVVVDSFIARRANSAAT